MAVRKMQAAITSGTSDATGGSAAPSSADGLLSLTDDELSALMPSAVGSATSLRRGEPVGAPSTARPLPKQSGRFVTDGGRLAAPKIVKRSTKRDQAVPHKASGAYAKAVAAKPTSAGRIDSTTAPPPRGASTKLEDFSDLVAEIESLDVTEDEQTVLISYDQLGPRPSEAPSVRAANVDVEATIAEAVKAALPQLATVPLSLATIAASPVSKPRVIADASPNRHDDPMPLGRAHARERLADVATPPASASTAALQAEPAPAPQAPAKRRRSVVGTLLVATALLGIVAGGAWVAGDRWAARGHAIPAQVGAPAMAPAPEPPPAPEPSVVTPEPSVVASTPVVAAEPEAPPDVPTSAPSTAATVTSPVAATAKPAAARRAASPSSESAAAVADGEPSNEPRATSKPARRARAQKGSDGAKVDGETNAEVDEETKKALEALQKSQLESSF